MYSTNVTDDELIQIATEFRDGMLGANTPGDGQCYKVSWPLVSVLQTFYDVDCTLAHNADTEIYEHYWIALKDGRVLDPTFDQFCTEEKVKVYLGPPTEYHRV